MKDLRWPGLWWTLWAALIGAVVGLSLAVRPPQPEVPDGDKWEHLAAYAALAIVAVQLFRAGRPLVLALVATVVLGVVLEVAQGLVTVDRVVDARDAVANTVGVVLGGLTALTPLRNLLLRWAARPMKVSTSGT